MSEPKDAVNAEIGHAFAETPRPPDEELVVAGPGEDPECDQLAAGLRGRTWQELPAETILKTADSLPLLTPAAFRYYLPAYLRTSLGQGDDPASSDLSSMDVANFVLFRLIPPEQPGDLEYFLTQVRPFSTQERQAVARYLKLIAPDREEQTPKPQRDEFARAIEYWEALV